VEKNATPWSRDRLTALLVGQTVEKGAVRVEFTAFKKLEGEATANNRKAKLIFLFEWELELKFTATVAGGEVEYTGVVEIPNLSDENEADEISVSGFWRENSSEWTEFRPPSPSRPEVHTKPRSATCWQMRGRMPSSASVGPTSVS